MCRNRGLKYQLAFLLDHPSITAVNRSWSLGCKHLKSRKIADRTRATQLTSDSCSNREEKVGNWADDTLAKLFDMLWPLGLQGVQRLLVHFSQRREETWIFESSHVILLIPYNGCFHCCSLHHLHPDLRDWLPRTSSFHGRYEDVHPLGCSQAGPSEIPRDSPHCFAPRRWLINISWVSAKAPFFFLNPQHLRKSVAPQLMSQEHAVLCKQPCEQSQSTKSHCH